MREEWEALLDETPGHVSKLLHAVDLFRAVPGLKHEASYPGVPHRPLFESAVRGLDMAVAAISLVLCLPLMLLLVIAIKVESKGPAVTRYPCLGRHKSEFHLYSFRTSKLDSGRITRSGRFVRLSRLDELPQLVNILLGHMTLVGPPPIGSQTAELLATVRVRIPSAVFSIRPGLTGRAQLTVGAPSLSDSGIALWEQRLSCDVQYVMRRGLLENLRILLATARIVLFGARESDPPEDGQ
jgi:lipopolysaccharide/colanic/teichoic acid biosynthesis glycosyltransferase